MKHRRFRKYLLFFTFGVFAGMALYRKYGPKGCVLLQDERPVFSSTILLRILTQKRNSTDTQSILRILDGCKVDVEVVECGRVPCRADVATLSFRFSKVIRYYRWLVVAADVSYIAEHIARLHYLLMSIRSEQPIILFHEECTNSGVLVASAAAVSQIVSKASYDDDGNCSHSEIIIYHDLDELITGNLVPDLGSMNLRVVTEHEDSDTRNKLIFHETRKMSSLQTKLELLMKEVNIIVMKYLSQSSSFHKLTVATKERIQRNSKEWDFVNGSLIHSLSNSYADPTYGILNKGRQLLNNTAQMLSQLPFPESMHQRVTHFGVEHLITLANVSAKSIHNPQMYRILQPFEGQHVHIEKGKYTKDLVILLPLYRRSGMFSRFLKRLQSVALDFKGILMLHVVLFEDKKHDHQITLNTIEESKGKLVVQVLQASGQFSRAEGISQGLELLHEGTRVLIMDVDMMFTVSFLQRVVQNTKQSSQAYFPIYFSRYDPTTISTASASERRHPHNEEFGMWRHFSFGIVGVYKSDILAMGGFDRSLKGWGHEDVFFYEKCVTSHLKIFRSVDPGLWHMYHERHCSHSLREPQKSMCYQSRLQLQSSQKSSSDLLYLLMKIKTRSNGR